MKHNIKRSFDHSGGFLSLLTILISIIIMYTFSIAYAQDSTSNQTGLNQTGSLPGTTGATADFETTKQQYLSNWENLGLQSAFDIFVVDGSVQGYGIYQQQPSNIFSSDEAIVLYVEPIGYSFNEGVDKEGNTLYSYNLTAVIVVADKQGNQLAAPIQIESDKSLNSYNKQTEAFLSITPPQPEPFPLGEYNITYTITDGVSGESFDIVRDVKIAEILSPGE